MNFEYVLWNDNKFWKKHWVEIIKLSCQIIIVIKHHRVYVLLQPADHIFALDAAWYINIYNLIDWTYLKVFFKYEYDFLPSSIWLVMKFTIMSSTCATTANNHKGYNKPTSGLFKMKSSLDWKAANILSSCSCMKSNICGCI